MIGVEVVLGLPELRRAEECPYGDAMAVNTELVVSAVRPVPVRRYERAEGAAPAVVARVLEVREGSLGADAEPGDLVARYSESLGDVTPFRRLMRRGRPARFRALVETPLPERTVPGLREFGGHPL